MGHTARTARQIRWYIRALMGDSHYRRYLEYRLRTHPGEPVLTESDYWRMRHRHTETSPAPRCC